MTIRIGINGFGRIGRMVTRAAYGRKDIEIVHINDLTDTKTLAHLTRYDSVHGTWDVPVKADGDFLLIGDKRVSVSKVKDPAEIPWKDKNVDIVMECTGKFRKRDECEKHIKGGAKKVIVSAPAEGEDLTIVIGVNDNKIDKAKHIVVSCGSCTTNCLAPFTKVLNDKFGIKKGLMTTIHSYTNDQAILDFPHKDLRRARAAAMSMIPTSTGAAKAIGLVIPELKGKLNGLAVRVPTPNVSMVDVVFEVNKATTKEEVNKAIEEAANGPLKGILGYCDEELVSIDFNGDPRSSIVDGTGTFVMDGNMVKVMSWYDNEFGFSNRMCDLAARLI
jgi:glyceraldehyde 3-phosphate dehydrogenase